jgi:hypothetical protein
VKHESRGMSQRPKSRWHQAYLNWVLQGIVLYCTLGKGHICAAKHTVRQKELSYAISLMISLKISLMISLKPSHISAHISHTLKG